MGSSVLVWHGVLVWYRVCICIQLIFFSQFLRTYNLPFAQQKIVIGKVQLKIGIELYSGMYSLDLLIMKFNHYIQSHGKRNRTPLRNLWACA
ncbi:hypothetical protein BDZ91DRAFT_723613 [Kalaharituber pfeilii]|nr:hypothetical protein BDZ91DRAFT_723613 [Kalaharituber pfeilii]